MKKTVKFLALAFAVAGMALSVASCKPKEEPKQEEPKQKQGEMKSGKIEFLNASDYAEWVYYSLKDNKIYKTAKYNIKEGKLEGAPAADDKNWDIAFHRWDVMTQGGVFKSEEKDLSKAKDVKVGEFTMDEECDITYVFDHDASKKVTGKMKASKLLSGSYKEGMGWIYVNISKMPPVYKVAENVWFVKTAEGKIVALKFTGCKNKEGKPIGISLNYEYMK